MENAAGWQTDRQPDEIRAQLEQQSEQLLSEITCYYDGIQTLPPLLVHKNELEEMLRLETAQDAGGCTRVGALCGRAGCGKKFLMLTMAHTLKRALLLTDGLGLMRLYRQYGDMVPVCLAWRQASENCLLCLTDCEMAEETAAEWKTFIAALARQGASFWMTMTEETDLTEAVGENVLCGYVRWTLPDPDIRTRSAIWEYFLRAENVPYSVDPEVLGGRYRFHCGEIRQAVKSAVLNRIRFGRQTLSEEDIREAAKLWKRGSLGELAQEIPCVFSWEDLVTDQTLSESLHELCGLVLKRSLVGEAWGFYEKRPYGNGLCVLFYGPSGTGKTMAAQVVAKELGMELYRVDLSQISSKYIGETQKNLHRLFDEAEEGNFILFFDEADAFFSRRTNVKDANDRHANSEVAYLLQRLEAYEGVTILATNLKNQFDDAFRRRIRRMIHFPLPDADTRKRIWEKAFPKTAPLKGDVEFAKYAEKFELSSAEIKEAALDAAFFAAEKSGEIGNQEIQKALRICYQKYGRVLGESDFL